MHQLRLMMRIMFVCSPTTLLFSLSCLDLSTGGVVTGDGEVIRGAGPPSGGAAVIHGTPRNIPVAIAKRFYEPGVVSPYSSHLLTKQQRPANLDFVDFLLGDEQKRAEERHEHHAHLHQHQHNQQKQPWDPMPMDYIDFLIGGQEMEGPSAWKKQPLFHRGTAVPDDDLNPRGVLTLRGGGLQQPQRAVKFRPMHAYEEILRRRKRSKEDTSNIDQWKSQKNVKETGINNGGSSGKSAIANSISGEGQSQNYGSMSDGITPSVEPAAHLDDKSPAVAWKRPGLGLGRSEDEMEKKEEDGERFRSLAFNRGGDRPSYDEFIFGEKRPIQHEKQTHDDMKPWRAPQPEMTYDEFLFGRKRNFQQQQQQQPQSAIGEFQIGKKDKSFMMQKPECDEFPLRDMDQPVN